VELIVRATVVYWLLWLLLRVAGKRELAEMTPFELIVLMVMGDLIQQGVTQEDMSVTGAALSVTTIALWTIALSYATFRSRRLGELFESAPAIVVSDGTIDTAMLATHRLTIDDLLDEARNDGIERVADIKYAVLEADGKISFLRTRTDVADTLTDDDDEHH
jgi:uncharacterized membrane protein YcaP (DUF421 family)